MGLLLVFIAIVFSAAVSIPLVPNKVRGIVAVVAVYAIAAISSLFAIKALGGESFEYIFPGSFVTGPVPVRIDALSAWFILTINISFVLGSVYGFHYMKAYKEHTAKISMHAIAFVLVHASLISVCALQNGMAFLIAWEIMALSAFVLVIFEHEKQTTLKAGINYLIQSHVSVVFLMLAFIGAFVKTDSLDFQYLVSFSDSGVLGLGLFFCFFIGFAIKAGFVPFHTWLPHAHPAAPAHISGLMSGVIIKIGIYGILRILLLIQGDYLLIGFVILFISVISGVYGVMLAIIQHNLKRLLAYHSIENIGIIGIGIGLGCLGLGFHNQILSFLGFAGALLHTLNHSLFKSLLFYGAGNIYQATHTMNIEYLGGLGKKMPYTSLLFLLAALAICGLPPFNGFISEFLIYSGMFTSLKGAEISSLTLLIFSISGLTLIGGLAIMCFTKAFGTIFLGSARTSMPKYATEQGAGKLIPMFIIMGIMIVIGIFPQYAILLLAEPLKLFVDYPGYSVPFMNFPFTETLTRIGSASIGFLGLAGIVFLVKKSITSVKSVEIGPTWGCGYIASTPKIQYTASSFVKSYTKLAEPLLLIYKKRTEVEGVFPQHASFETHPDDKAEVILIDTPVGWLKRFFNRFTFLQKGNPQVYVLYGMVFITLVLGLPMIVEALRILLHYFNQL